MCGCDPTYLSEGAGGHGSQRLLHWSAADVVSWLKGIELEGYVAALEGKGINGAVMVGGHYLG